MSGVSMSGVSGDRRPRNIPHDGFELLREDIENMIGDEMRDCGNIFIDMDAERYNVPISMFNGGIIKGLMPSTIVGDNRHIVVSAGVAYDKNAIRFEHAQKTLDVLNASDYEGGSTATSGYIVAKIQVLDDPATLGTHPFSGHQAAKRKMVQCDILLTTTAPIGLKWVDNKRIYLGSWFLDGGVGGTLKLFERCQETYSSGLDSLNVYPYNPAGSTPTEMEARGVPGTKYWIRMRKEVGYSIIISESGGFSDLNAHYLDVVIPTDVSGTVIVTFQEVMDAINTSTYFRAALGPGTTPTNPFNVTTAYSDEYKSLTGGRDYRQYAQAKVGTWSLYHSIPDRFNPSDPYTRHLMMKGHGIQKENNPHGIGIDDIDGLVDEMRDHQRREHNRQRSGISRGSTSTWLSTSGSGTSSITISTESLNPLNRAIVDGMAVNTGGASAIFTQTPVPSFAPFTAEFVLSKSGTILRRDVARWVNGGANIAPVGFPTEALFSIVDKDPNLEGTYLLSLSVDSSGNYTMSFGGIVAGPSVDVTVNGNTYTLYLKNGQWIKVFHEIYATPLPPSTSYQNDIVFLKSEQNDTSLSISMAAFRNGTAPRLWDHIKDCRVYGTLSVEHDAYEQVGDAISFGCRFDGTTLLALGTPPINSLRPFDVDYRGRTYHFDSCPISSIDTSIAPLDTTGNPNFLAVRFDEARNSRVINLGTSLAGVWNIKTDVLLGILVYSGGVPSQSLSIFFKRLSSIGYAVNVLKIGTEWTIDEALKYATVCCRDPFLNANVVFVFDLMTDVVSTVPSASIGRLVINGNEHSISGNTIISTNDLLARDVLFSGNFRFEQNGAIGNSLFDHIKTSGTYTDAFLSLGSPSIALMARDSYFTHAGRPAIHALGTGSCGIVLENISWYGTGTENCLVMAQNSFANVLVDRMNAISSGTLFEMGATTQSLTIRNSMWNHQDVVGDPAIPISVSGNTIQTSLCLIGNKFNWSLVNSGYDSMIEIIDLGVRVIFTMEGRDNDIFLQYPNDSMLKSFVKILCLGGTGFRGDGLDFSGNKYHVFTTNGTWAIINNTAGAYYRMEGKSYGGHYSSINEKIMIGTATLLQARNVERIVCAESFYKIKNLIFDEYHAFSGVARQIIINANDYIAIRNLSVFIDGIIFPEVVLLPSGEPASEHIIRAEAQNQIDIYGVKNLAKAGDDCIYVLTPPDKCEIRIRYCDGNISDYGNLISIYDGSNDNLRVIVSGCHASNRKDATGYTAIFTKTGSGHKSFCVGNCQDGGNAAVCAGFDVASNHHVA